MSRCLRQIVYFMLIWIGCSVQADNFFPTNSTWRYFIGTTEASSPVDAWRQNTYNDASWSEGQAPIGYGDPGIVTGVPTSENGGYVSMFFRKSFNVPNPTAVSRLDLAVRVDDGYVAWINGVEVGRYNFSTNAPVYNATATNNIEPTWITNSITTNVAAYLVPGNNVIAIQVFNYSQPSVDLLFDAQLSTPGNAASPVITDIAPPADAILNQLSQITVTFSEGVTNIFPASLLINQAPATNMLRVASNQFTFQFTTPAAGNVDMTWNLTTNITDLASNAFAGLTWSYLLDFSASSNQLYINEFLAANKNSIRDEDGDASDWIEIFNGGALTANLTGWALTDEATNLVKWRFPNITLAPRAYLVVYASGKNRTNASAKLHANFQLDKGGEYLALVDPQTNVVSDFGGVYPPQSTDVSYGRVRGDLAHFGYFSMPSPGGPNMSSGGGFTTDIVFSRGSGTFTNTFQLTLNTADTNAQIRFVVGSTLPTESSPLYAGPITVSNTTVVRARAFAAGLLPGEVKSRSYIQMETATNTAAFNTDVPIVLLHSYGAGVLPTNGDSFVIVQVYEPKNGVAMFTNAPDLAMLGIYHVRGKSSYSFPKRNFFVELQDEYGDDKHVSFAGLPDQSDWVLYSIYQFDPSMMHNPMAHALFRQMGHYSANTSFAELFLHIGTNNPAIAPLTFSSNYNGLYVIEEKIKIGKNRVEIDKLLPEQTNATTITGGYLFDVDDPPTTFSVAGVSNVRSVDPSHIEMNSAERTAQKNYLNSYWTAFNTALNGTNWLNPTNGYRAFVDTPSWIDFHLNNFIVFNVDGLRLSSYFYKPRGDKLYQGPMWDFDRTQGSTDLRAYNPRLWRSGYSDCGTDFFSSGNTFGNAWYKRLFLDLDFFQAWIDRYHDLRRGAYSTTNVWAMIDSFANQARNGQSRDVVKWTINKPRYGTVNQVGLSYTFPNPGMYQGEVDFLKYWYANRFDFLDSQLARPPALSRAGGPITNLTLTVTTQVGQIYYTLNGTDPRASGGAISTNAILYTNAIVLTNNARVVARTYDTNYYYVYLGSNAPPTNSPWSGTVEATYVAQTPQFVVTEIMFNPAAPTNGSTNDASAYEYIELKNVGTNMLTLAGFHFTNGIYFDFSTGTVSQLAPGGYVLLVRNRNAFLSRYPGVTNIAGEYSGSLNNSGERLFLEGPLKEPILNFSYDNSWQAMADGNGFSLVLSNEYAPFYSLTNRASWRLSSTEGGSPGQVDAVVPSISPILVNELLSAPLTGGVDTVELYNPNASAVDISGWYLSDAFNNPRKYCFPASSILPANGYLVVNETAFNVGSNSFAFSSNGDDVWLYAGNTNHLLGYYHGFSFGNSEPGVTFGRYVTSTGEEQFVPQATATLGTNNTGPRVGPLVFTEIHYNPTLPGDAYVEIMNITTNVVPLYDPAAPTNTWNVHGLDFYFPTNVSLNPGQTLLVTGTNAATFQTVYGVNSNTLVFGPFAGGLQTNGETLKLERPGTPTTNDVPHYTVDEINYDVVAPWPAYATNGSSSLQRVKPEAYGNDPIAWKLATISPGMAPPVLVQSPISQTSNAASNVSLNAVVLAPLAPRYQWYFNSAPLTNATNATLSLANISCTNDGQYLVIATNPVGAVTSTVATLTIPGTALPSIVTSPQSQTNDMGNTVTLAMVPSLSCNPLRFQWLFNNNPLAGATNASLVITNVQLTNSGSYSVIMSNVAGKATSAIATLTILSLPVITGPPANQSVYPGQSASFGVTVTGSPPLMYQWYGKGILLAGETNTTLLLSDVQWEQSGNYQVVVSNTYGSVTSAPATLTVWIAPVITSQPQSRTNLVGTTASFAVTANGAPDQWYQWYKSVTSNQWSGINGATNSQLSISNCQLSDAGSYSMVVSNVLGSVTSAVAVLTVWQAPVITTQPQNQSNLLSATASFSVSAYGSPEPWYQWRFNATNVLANQTNSTLTQTNIQTTNAGNYSVVITNTAGVVTSAVATLTVLTPPTITQQPVGTSVYAGQSATFTVTAINPAPITYQWFGLGAGLSGQTNAILTLTNVQAAQEGEYFALAANAYGSATSSVALLALRILPPSSAPGYFYFANSSGSRIFHPTDTAGGATTNTSSLKSNTVPFGNLRISVYYGVGGGPLQTNLNDVRAWNWNGSNSGNAGISGNALLAETGKGIIGFGTLFGGQFSAGNTTLTAYRTDAAATYPMQVRGWDCNAGGGSPTWESFQQKLTAGTLPIGTLYGLSPIFNQTANASTSLSMPYWQLTTVMARSPVIAIQPLSQTNLMGTTANFSVSATGNPAPWYQWYKSVVSNQWSVISGATNYQWSISNCQLSDAGSYTVVITNVAGSVTSAVTALTVLGSPQITALTSTNQTVLWGSNAVFTVSASGSTPLYYYWYLNSNFASVVSAQVSVTNPAVSCGNQGDYYNVVVSNAYGTAIAGPAYLGVMDSRLPAFTPALVHVTNTVDKGSNATLTVGVLHTCNEAYRWYFGPDLLPTQTTPTLSLTNVGLSQAGTYSLALSNANGTALGTAMTLVVHYTVTKPTIKVEENKFTLAVEAEPGRAYWLEVRDSLSSGTWTVIRGVTNTSGSTQLLDTNAAAQHRFYRIGSALLP
ncbi:MAG: immunoglobulin domain-containing protein [Verrucomicrobiota bacterium]